MAPNTAAESPHSNFDVRTLSQNPIDGCNGEPGNLTCPALHDLRSFMTILVLDFGSQTSHLILRRLRALGVFAELLPCNTKIAELTWKPKGIVFSGGPASVYDEVSPHVDPAVFELAVPILGICYGCQEIAWRVDSKNVARGEKREYGHADVNVTKVNSHADRLFAGMGDKVAAFMSHFDKLVKLPTDYVVIANTKNSEFAGIAHKEKPIFGVQFHPELEHTPCGEALLRNFSVDICGAQPNWQMGDFVQLEIARIRETVGDRALVLGACSGGVDSTVGAALMKEAIGDRFKAILIDNGCMRLNECEEVKKTLGDHLGIDLTVVDAGEMFLSRLAGGGLPQRMFRAIGRQLGVDESLVGRHPFPGPGIAIRILGDVTKERVEIARKADHIFISMIKEAGLYDQISQAFAGLDTNRSVGVFGDQRVWGYIIILRAVRTKDFMSAEIFKFDLEFLENVSRRICNEVEGVSRVTYDLTSKPPGTIELE
ncbi:GMP synthase [Apiospora saccharicola]|uniref:GMP synthase (glutamine-hydrolyzing) n=1 Tax=Apiospora saccharicola TaxID=335842 RepID=A0ABR1WNE3_9PEZI